MENKKYWCLYADEKQNKLLACAYEEDQIDFESQYYSKGCWFEYDIEVSKHKTEFLINEIKYKKIIIFPNPPFDRPKYGEEEEYNLAWTSMKKIVDTAEIR